MTWPISCTRINTTKIAANGQPKNSEYAPIEMIIVSAVPANLPPLSAKSASLPNLSRKNPTASTGANRRASNDGGADGGSTGGAGYPSGGRYHESGMPARASG